MRPAYSRAALGLCWSDTGHADDSDALLTWLRAKGVAPHALSMVVNTHASISGHGPPIRDVIGAAHAGLSRLAHWRERPEAAAWHACERILTHALIEHGGMTETAVAAHLAIAPSFADYAGDRLATPVEEAIAALIRELLRSGGARDDGGRTAVAKKALLASGRQAKAESPEYWPRRSALGFGGKALAV